jgi:hypothetical protein
LIGNSIQKNKNREVYSGICGQHRKIVSFCPKTAKLGFKTGEEQGQPAKSAKALTQNGFVPIGAHCQKLTGQESRDNREGAHCYWI